MPRHAFPRDQLIAAAIVAAVLLIYGPLFVRSPLGPDPVMYDLQARIVHDGGTLYRDILEPNLPGAVWIHLGVRSVGGWSPEALRLFDLAWFFVTAWLATRLIGLKSFSAALFMAVSFAGYSTLSEWCHCQRDEWMLPFVLGAILLRERRLEEARLLSRLADSKTNGSPNVTSRSRTSYSPFLLSFAEGLLWGAAVWLKPHVVVPVASVIAATWCWSMRASQAVSWRRLLVGEFAVLLSGMAVGAAGAVWLLQHEAWAPMWSMLTEWNRDYVAASANRWSWGRLWSIQERLAPWSLMHLVALPIAVLTVIRVRRTVSTASDIAAHQGASTPRSQGDPVSPLLASAAYLGWIVQSLLLQHLFDYVHVPALVLAAIVIGSHPWPIPAVQWSPRRLAVAALVGLAPSLIARGGQLSLWKQCVLEPTTPSLQAELARLPLPEWTYLARVENFLRARNVRDGELTAYHTHTIHLYPALQVRPSTRFVFTETHLRLFPARAAEIAEALRSSSQKYVVSDLLEAGLDPATALDDQDPDNWRKSCPTAALTAFPFDQPVIFRSGPYLVHEVTQPVGPVETGFFPLAAKSAGL